MTLKLDRSSYMVRVQKKILRFENHHYEVIIEVNILNENLTTPKV